VHATDDGVDALLCKAGLEFIEGWLCEDSTAADARPEVEDALVCLLWKCKAFGYIDFVRLLFLRLDSFFTIFILIYYTLSLFLFTRHYLDTHVVVRMQMKILSYIPILPLPPIPIVYILYILATDFLLSPFPPPLLSIYY
jgi:hypothetical protein